MEVTFAGPGDHWTYAEGKVAVFGETVTVNKEGCDRAVLAGVTLVEGKVDLHKLRRSATPEAVEAGAAVGGNPVNPQDGKPAGEIDTPLATGSEDPNTVNTARKGK